MNIKLVINVVGIILLSNICMAKIKSDKKNNEDKKPRIEEVIIEYETTDKVPKGEGKYKEVKTKRRRTDAIAFVDKEGKVRKQIKLKEVHGQALFGEKYTEIYPVFSNNKRFVAITEKESVKNPKDIHHKTGYKRKNKMNIEFYNEEGEVLFSKKNVDYTPEAISDNGKIIACIKWVPELLEGVSAEINKNPPKPKIIVLNNSGEVEFEKQEDSLIIPPVKVSENGKLLVYQMGQTMKVVDLESHSEKIITTSKMNTTGFYKILDDGTLISRVAVPTKLPNGDWVLGGYKEKTIGNIYDFE